MSIPLWAILIPYALYLVVYTTFVFVDLYHLLRFGTYDVVNFFAFAMFVSGLVFLCYATIFFLDGVDWLQPIGNTGSMEQFTTVPSL